MALSPGLVQLLREPSYAQVATIMPDGSPQLTQVWIDTDGEHVLLNLTDTRKKTDNLRRDPRVAVNVHDPKNPWRIAHIRGQVVEITPEGGREGINSLAKKYLGADEYPWFKEGETRLVVKIKPERVIETGIE